MDPSPAALTLSWVRNFVVRHGLCPFAAAPLRQRQVRVVSFSARQPEELLRFLLSELLQLIEVPATTINTTLIVYPRALADFEDFLDFLTNVEASLAQAGLTEMFQLAHFHPQYQFAGVPVDDPANATNRSPFPTVQLLRVDEVASAINAHPDPEGIPDRNVALLRRLATQTDTDNGSEPDQNDKNETNV